MSAVTRSKAFRFADFCLLTGDRKADLIDGVIYMASPDNTDAADLFMWFGGLMEYYVEFKELGKVYGSRVAFRLNDRNSPEPDIAFICKRRLHLVHRGHVAGAPDLAAEIVSPESVQRDYEAKRDLYQKAGVREYWIIDEMRRRVTLLRLTAKGIYRKVRPQNGVLRSEVVAGFWIRPEWLWQNPRPKKLEVLQQLLAGRP